MSSGGIWEISFNPRRDKMKKKAIIVLGAAALIAAGCAIPLGENFTIPRETAQSGIYIVDYNLQTYVPVPVTGEEPVQSVTQRGDLKAEVIWKAGGKDGTPIEDLARFEANTVYGAKITLSPEEGYRFNPKIPFGYHPGKIASGDDNGKDAMGSASRIIEVTYNNSDDGLITFVTDYELQKYVPIPVVGAVPVLKIDKGEVEGAVTWQEDGGTLTGSSFQAAKTYAANINIRARADYRFRGDKDFSYSASYPVKVQPVSNRDPATRDLSPVTYDKALVKVTALDLTDSIATPLNGASANTTFTSSVAQTSQYNGSAVKWTNTADEQVVTTFTDIDTTAYTATVTLTAAPGYTFEGLTAKDTTFFHNNGFVLFTSNGITGTAEVVFNGKGRIDITIPWGS
jgi:hypothetical protein